MSMGRNGGAVGGRDCLPAVPALRQRVGSSWLLRLMRALQCTMFQYCVRLTRPLVRHRGIADLQILAQLVGQLRSVVEGCGTGAEEAVRTDDREDSR